MLWLTDSRWVMDGGWWWRRWWWWAVGVGVSERCLEVVLRRRC